MDLREVSLLINKQAGGGEEEQEKGREKGTRARLVNHKYRKRDFIA